MTKDWASFEEDLAVNTVVRRSCKVCLMLSRLPEDTVKVVKAALEARTDVDSWGISKYVNSNLVLASAFSSRGFLISKDSVRRHRGGHSE